MAGTSKINRALCYIDLTIYGMSSQTCLGCINFPTELFTLGLFPLLPILWFSSMGKIALQCNFTISRPISNTSAACGNY